MSVCVIQLLQCPVKTYSDLALGLLICEVLLTIVREPTDRAGVWVCLTQLLFLFSSFRCQNDLFPS